VFLEGEVALGYYAGLLKKSQETGAVRAEKPAKKTAGAYRKMWGEDGNGTRPIKLN
jgi:hypothetical protein